MGQIAAREILAQINRSEEFIPQSVTLKTELIVRNSSRRIRD
jgi:DNA-binding LacI/PurR family transcriptional regulator